MFAYCRNKPVTQIDASGAYDMCVINFNEDSNPFNDLVSPSGGGGGGIAARKNKGFVEKTMDFLTNTSEEVVLEAEYFAFYNGVLVIKTNLPEGSGFSCGIVLLDKETVKNDTRGVKTLRHEYGHTQHLIQIGFSGYLCTVIIPSAVGAYLSNRGLLPVDYYSLPWERIADHLGNVQGRIYEPWANATASVYWVYSYVIGRTN